MDDVARPGRPVVAPPAARRRPTAPVRRHPVGCAAGSFRSADAGTVAPAEIDFDYVIPAGTSEQIDAGDEVEILPAEIDATVGQVIRIVNDDERGFNVGPFFVGAGETISQRFGAAGEFTGECAVHPSGQLVLRVRDRTAS